MFKVFYYLIMPGSWWFYYIRPETRETDDYAEMARIIMFGILFSIIIYGCAIVGAIRLFHHVHVTFR